MPAPDPGHRAWQAWPRLHVVGTRHTVARATVIDVLAETDGHLSVGDIHQQVAARRPEVNISTVHRTIAYLLDHQVAHVLARPGEARYGLNERPHVHAVCDRCGTMTEIPAAGLAAAIDQARRASPLELADTGLVLVGKCTACRHPSPR